MTGFAVSTVRLAAPDTGLISYGEMVEQGRSITAAVSIPVIGDGDTGYGNALNVKRTVKGYIQAGFAGILLEDQVLPNLVNNTDNWPSWICHTVHVDFCIVLWSSSTRLIFKVMQSSWLLGPVTTMLSSFKILTVCTGLRTIVALLKVFQQDIF